MTSFPARQLLSEARLHGYAIGAFNAVNLETAEAVVTAAELEDAPVILQFSQNAARYSSLTRLMAIGRVLRQEAGVPVILHFDHAESLGAAKAALKLGFDSVMLEGAHLAWDEHLRQSRALVREAHAVGAAVEVELEIVQKGDRIGTAKADPEQLGTFVNATDCDLLAIDIGTEHKQTEKTAQLDFKRLERIALAFPHPLVLHGSSGVPDEVLQTAVAKGITKVNLATALMRAFTNAVRQQLVDPDLHDPRRYLGAGREAMLEESRRLIRLLGGSGRVEG